MDSIWVFVGAIFALIGLGLVASFSPVLYTFIGVSTRTKESHPYLIATTLGITVSVLLLSLLFQFFHPNSLFNVLNSTVEAVLVSTWFHILVGIALVASGVLYYYKRPMPKKKAPEKPAKSGVWASASLGFLRTTFSVSGFTSIYIANSIISNASHEPIGKIILLGVLVAAAVVPFFVIYWFFNKYPKMLDKSTSLVHRIAKSGKDKPILGGTSVVVGAVIVISAITGWLD